MNKLLFGDLNHLIYVYGTPFFKSIWDINTSTEKIKNIIATAKNETNSNFVVVVGDLHCHDRINYFKELFPNNSNLEYKGNRQKDEKWYELNNKVVEELSQLYPLIRKENYEADDIITALVEKLNNKCIKYILTIDADILPLVDKYTNVLLYKNKISKKNIEPLFFKYYLFNTENFSNMIRIIKSFDFENITVNNLLLIKMLIGDPSDNTPRVNKFTSKNIKDFLKWSNIDKNFKWSYFETTKRIEEELSKILINPIEKSEALRNFKIMKMNSTLGNRRKKFEIRKEFLTTKGIHH